jgi:hypothetical protein
MREIRLHFTLIAIGASLALVAAAIADPELADRP